MMRLDRITTEYDLDAMVAGDNFDLLVERITPMVTAGRGMVLAVREFTHLQHPPRIYSGLRLDTSGLSGGIWTSKQDNHLWYGITLTDGSGSFDATREVGFGEDVYPHSGNVTEVEAWKRYHEHEAEHRDHFQRRRDMTHIAITGGIPGWRYTRDDKIVITSWNRDGIATEKVLGFDPADGNW